MITKKTLLLCGITGALVSSSAFATTNNGFYVGGQFGYAGNNSSASSLNAVSVPVVVGSTQYNLMGPAKTTVDNDNIGGRAYIGYQFNRFLSLEGGYTQYSDTVLNNVYGVRGQDQSLFEGALDGVVKGSFPITKRVSIYAKGGAAYVFTQNLPDYKPTALTLANAPNLLDVDTNNIYEFRPTYGAGVNVDITQRLSADVSWSQIVGGDNVPTTNFAGVGLAFHF